MKELVSILILSLLLFISCANTNQNPGGNYGIFNRKTGGDAKATKQKLIDNWSDFDIWLYELTGYKPPRLIAVVFDSRDDDRKILVGSSWRKLKDQEMWTEIVEKNNTRDGEFILAWGLNPYYDPNDTTAVEEISGPDSQHYGFIIYQEIAVVLERVELVNENEIRFTWHTPATVTHQ